MKIALPINEEKNIRELIRIKDQNIEAADMFLFILENVPDAVDEEDLQNEIKITHGDASTAYGRLLLKAIGADPAQKDIRALAEQYLYHNVRQLDPKAFAANSYYRTVLPKPLTLKRWKLGYIPYAPYEFFVADDVSIAPNNFQEQSHFGYFPEEFPYLAVMENDTIWMSVTPNEIVTMQPVIDACHGKVLTFGLGLGYFAYMAALKPDVKSVTIVEQSADVIALFNRCLLPFFPHPEKIHIIHSDAFAYAEKDMPKDAFDCAFVDLWHGADDGLPLYIKMRELETKNPRTVFYYWLEKSMLAMLRRYVLTLVEEALNGIASDMQSDPNNATDVFMNRLYLFMKEKVILSENDVRLLLSDVSIKQMAAAL